MKTSIISKVILTAAFALALVSCAEEFQYEPGKAVDASKTYVAVDLAAARSLEVAGENILVPFVRNSKEGALEVEVFIEDTTNVFHLASPSIIFADGDSLANATVTYNYADLEMDFTYNIVVGIADESYISDYAPSNFPLALIKAWENLGLAQFYDDWWVGGPFEKTLLKSPDGSDTYRLVNPWAEEEVTAGGLTFVSPMDYFEFSVDEEGNISYSDWVNLGFTYGGRTCHNVRPSVEGDAASDAQNKMVADKVAQFVWYPEMNNGKNWWGVTSVAYISFPGGPDLAELLGL